MQLKTKVVIKVQQNRTVNLGLHPQMTARELQQLIQASTCLNSDFFSSTSKSERPTFLVSCQRNLLIDYLLTSSCCSLSKICQIQNKLASLTNPLHYVKSHLRLREEQNMQNQHPIMEALYLEIVSVATHTENQTVCLNYHLPKSKRLTLTTQNKEEKIQFQSSVTLKRRDEGLYHKIMVDKQTLKSFNHFEKLMKIRERLIEQTKNHTNIFKELFQTSQDQENLVFWVKYCPAISIKEILNYNLHDQCKQVLVKKILAFSVYLCHEGFFKCIKRLIQLDNLSSLLDAIMVDFSQNLYLGDLNLILQKDQMQSLKISQGQWSAIERQIKKYLLTQNQQSTTQKPYTFANIFIEHFSTKSCRFKIDIQDTFRPQSSFFSWQAKSSQREQTIQRNEGTTVKKKFIKQETSKKRWKSQKTKLKHFQQYTLPSRKEKKSNKKKNMSFA